MCLCIKLIFLWCFNQRLKMCAVVLLLLCSSAFINKFWNKTLFFTVKKLFLMNDDSLPFLQKLCSVVKEREKLKHFTDKTNVNSIFLLELFHFYSAFLQFIAMTIISLEHLFFSLLSLIKRLLFTNVTIPLCKMLISFKCLLICGNNPTTNWLILSKFQCIDAQWHISFTPYCTTGKIRRHFSKRPNAKFSINHLNGLQC